MILLLVHQHDKIDSRTFTKIFISILSYPRAACVVAPQLQDVGFSVTSSVGEHGVIRLLANGSGKFEKTGLQYAGELRTLGRVGTIIALFQPDEEIPDGTQAKIDDGLYKICPTPNIMLAQHVGMSNAGLVAARTSPVLPALDYIELEIFSKGVGANPSECRDPVSLASLYLRLELKTTEIIDRDSIFSRVEAITKGECKSSGGNIDSSVRMAPRAPVTRNNTVLDPPMDMPVEYFSIPVPFVYWKLGSTDLAKWDEAKKGCNIWEHPPTHHSSEFAPVPELTISTGMEAMALATLLFADKKTGCE
ncbi:Zn-dependent exopeptidase [Nemania sp. FL0031]|nr:Zn-dependent exopeptidase [Nemania sp. FL0031]